MEGSANSEERHSVSELVRNYSDSAGDGHSKRDRSESGDSAPPGKRGAHERGSRLSTSPRNGDMKQYLDDAIEMLEDRLRSSISKDLHEFREVVSAQLSVISDRVRDLERHVEEKDCEVAELTSELAAARADIKQLQDRAENSEMNSRIPCLILSGKAMAPRRPQRLDAPLTPTGHAAPPGTAGPGPTVRAESADARPAASSARGAARGGRDAPEVEDVNSLVIETVRARLPGLHIEDADIDRCHRLPGGNHKIIIRFVRSGPGSIRDQLMSRRLELRGQELYVNESLTAKKNLIYRSLLDAKKEKKIYTVFTRWGHVYYKSEKFGTSARVDSVDKLRELSLPVKQ